MYIKHQKRIYAYILMLVPNTSDADDILQQVSSFLWERFDQFEPGTNFGAWAVQIAKNYILDHYKKQRRSKLILAGENLESFSGKASQVACRIDQRLEILQKCLRELSANDSKLMKARYEEGLKIKDIAMRIGRPVGGLYKAINRIHNSLLKCIRYKMLTQDIV